MQYIITAELQFATSRSGGKGGQNVNKVETKVEACWNISASNIINDEQKILVALKLKNKINDNGELKVTCSTDRTQLGNKEKVIEKINKLVNKALIIPVKRKPTKVPKAVIEKRINDKKKKSEIKDLRKKL